MPRAASLIANAVYMYNTKRCVILLQCVTESGTYVWRKNLDICIDMFRKKSWHETHKQTLDIIYISVDDVQKRSSFLRLLSEVTVIIYGHIILNVLKYKFYFRYADIVPPLRHPYRSDDKFTS